MVEKKATAEETEAFKGQAEAKAASFDSFKFAVEHDPKDAYISQTDYVQHKDSIKMKEDVPVAAPVLSNATATVSARSDNNTIMAVP